MSNLHIYSRPSWIGLLLTLCLTAAGFDAAAGGFVFNWPRTAEARVTVDAEKNGETMRMVATLKVSTSSNDGLYLVEHADVQLLEVGGVDLSSPEARAAIPPQTSTMLKALPSLLISENGELVDVTGLDRLMQGMINGIPSDAENVDPEQIREFMTSPLAKQMLQAKAANDWATWVGNWVGMEIDAGERMDFEVVVPAFGDALPSTGYLKNLGPDPAHPGSVRLKMELVTEGKAIVAAVAKTLGGAMQEKPADLDALVSSIESAKRVQASEVLTDSETLLPYQAASSMTVTIKVKGQDPQVQREVKRFVFDWQGDR